MNNRAELKDALDKFNLSISDFKLDQLLEYLDLLYQWNEKINLTAIPKEKAIMLHLVDSLSLVKVVNFTEKKLLIDIGTGAGFPGVPLKIVFPEIEITLVDSTRKKLSFIENAISSIGIKAKFMHSRAEDLAKNIDYKFKFDLVVARAVAELKDLIPLLFPFCKKGGSVIAMKGPDINSELENARKVINQNKIIEVKVEEFKLPNSDIGRTLVFMAR